MAGLTPNLRARLEQLLSEVKFGSIQIFVSDGEVTGITTTESIRLPIDPEEDGDRRVFTPDDRAPHGRQKGQRQKR